jgi:triosephosphate isomerase
MDAFLFYVRATILRMKSIVVANWKMNPATFREARFLFEATKKAAEGAKNVSVIVAPPSIFLREFSASYRGSRLSFAVQNACFEKAGAHTGEISFAQAKDAKVSCALVGHAERRALGETNDDTRKKVLAALAQKITPILCVGEAKRTASGEHFIFIKEQLRVGLADVPAGNIGRIMVAYEPLWAIGAPKPMNSRDMHEMAIFVRKTVVEIHGEKGMNVKILYGGAIDETNAADMLLNGDVTGFVLGRASEEPHKFTGLMQSIANI